MKRAAVMWCVLAVSSKTLTQTEKQLSPPEWINKAWGTLIPLGDRCHVNLPDGRMAVADLHQLCERRERETTSESTNQWYMMKDYCMSKGLTRTCLITVVRAMKYHWLFFEHQSVEKWLKISLWSRIEMSWQIEMSWLLYPRIENVGVIYTFYFCKRHF